MNQTDGARWRGFAAATLLVVTGAVIGVLADRYWLAPPTIHGAPLTAEAMTAQLHLAPDETARLQVLLDSLHGEILAVVQQGPDSLAKAARNAQLRIEAALPPNARPEFRAWMLQHHDQLMNRMHGDVGDHRRMRGADSTRRDH